MEIRVMIAEDERLAREELLYLLGQEKDIVLLPSASNGRELLELAEQFAPHVIFLDVQMPEMTGIHAARILSSNPTKPLMVITTAYEDYAVEAFGLDAVDYLLKPYDHSRLKETLHRVRLRLNKSSRVQPREKIAKLLIDDGQRMIVIDPESILYAVREDRVIQIHTAKQVYSSKMTLQQLEEKLAAHSFFRTHRSYLININHVEEVIPWFNGAYNLVLKDSGRTQIPVSRSAAKEFLEKLQ